MPEYLNWPDFMVYLLFFMMGYLVFSEPQFKIALEKNRWPALLVGLVSSFFIHTALQAGRLGEWMEHPAYSMDFLIFQVAVSLNVFAWIIFLMGIGPFLFRSPRRHLGYLNEAVLPFYVLHQTVILLLGFYIVQLGSSIAMKYVLVTISSLIVITVLLELLIRRFPPLRWIFGMQMRH